MLLAEARVPELPLASDQFTGRLDVNVTVPFSPAYVAEGVMINPPLVMAATPVPVRLICTGDPASFPLIATMEASAATRDGLKLTEIVQDAPEGTILPQVLETRKSVELPLVNPMPDNPK